MRHTQVILIKLQDRYRLRLINPIFSHGDHATYILHFLLLPSADQLCVVSIVLLILLCCRASVDGWLILAMSEDRARAPASAILLISANTSENSTASFIACMHSLRARFAVTGARGCGVPMSDKHCSSTRKSVFA